MTLKVFDEFKKNSRETVRACLCGVPGAQVPGHAGLRAA